jgi:hypothetical protein
MRHGPTRQDAKTSDQDVPAVTTLWTVRAGRNRSEPAGLQKVPLGSVS